MSTKHLGFSQQVVLTPTSCNADPVHPSPCLTPSLFPVVALVRWSVLVLQSPRQSPLAVTSGRTAVVKAVVTVASMLCDGAEVPVVPHLAPELVPRVVKFWPCLVKFWDFSNPML